MATTVIGAHAFEHMYGRAFLVLIPAIYVALGLAPIQAGLLDAVRQLSGGVTSMTGGFFVDVFHHRRAHVLALSLALIAVGYFLVSIAPTYGLILAALAVASAGTALWHPPALGLLAQRFPARRGLFISMHRSTGNAGDWIGPLIVGGLLGVVGWRWIMGGGTPLLLVFAAATFLLLRNLEGPSPELTDYRARIKSQLSSPRHRNVEHLFCVGFTGHGRPFLIVGDSPLPQIHRGDDVTAVERAMRGKGRRWSGHDFG